MKCKQCGAENREGNRFCQSCGSKLETEIICVACGEKNDSSYSFCKNCGRPLNQSKTLAGTAKNETYLETAPQNADGKQKKSPLLIAGIAAVGVAALFLINQKVIQPSMTYKTAESLMAGGNYEEAVEKFSELEDYKDAPERLLEAKYMLAGALVEEKEYDAARKIYKELGDYQDAAEKEESAKDLQYVEGNEVIFGTYEQDDNLENGAEPIEWIVLKRDGENALLLSKYALDAKPFNDQDAPISWEKCTLRKWLNEDFLNTAFTEEEKEVVQLRNVDNGLEQQCYSMSWINAMPDRYRQNDTMDKVFLLSTKEVYKNYKEYVKGAEATQRVLNMGIRIYPELGNTCRWWLRSQPADNVRSSRLSNPAFVDAAYAYANSNFLGQIDSSVNNIKAIRPAIWINLNNSIV